MSERSHFSLNYMHTSHIVIHVFRKVSEIIPSRTLVHVHASNSLNVVIYYTIGNQLSSVCYTCLKSFCVIKFHFRGWGEARCFQVFFLFIHPFIHLSCVQILYAIFSSNQSILWASNDLSNNFRGEVIFFS